MQTRKIFISYSWTTPIHESWVLELAHRLTHDGVHVILDKWDLKPGQDKYTFMEQMVHADDIDKVLIILDKKYTERANNRSGGVGTETTIISTKVYESTTQEKFIPIVAERDENGNAFLPTYLGTRIYVDLSSESGYEDAYEQLLRQIYERPLLLRPKLGVAPKYLFTDSPASYKTSSILRSFDSQIDRYPQRINTLARDFFDTLFTDLSSFPFKESQNNWNSFGEALVDNLNRAKALRDDYIELLFKLTSSNNGFDTDILVGFFENLTAFFSPPENVSNWANTACLTFKFWAHEFWLYTIAIGLKRENYTFLTSILHSSYFTKEKFKETQTKHFEIFFKYLDNELKHYIHQSTGQNLITAHGHLLTSRIPEQLKKSDLTSADILCFYIAQIGNFHWFPITYIYFDEYSRSFPLISKLLSKKHFQKVHKIFGFDDITAMKEAFSKLDEKKERGYDNSFSYIPTLGKFVKIEDIGTYN